MVSERVLHPDSYSPGTTNIQICERKFDSVEFLPELTYLYPPNNALFEQQLAALFFPFSIWYYLEETSMRKITISFVQLFRQFPKHLVF